MKVLRAAGFAFWLFALTPAAAQESDLAKLQSIEWVEENRAELEALVGDRKNATSLMVAITGEDIVIPNVGEYLFIDLNGDNRLELAASIDFSGRAFYATAAVVYQSERRLDYQFLGGKGLNIANLPNSIEDIDGDGDLEILIPRLLEPYQGAEPVAAFTDVFSWDGEKYAVSHPLEYEDFYRNRILPRLERNIGTLSQGKGPIDPERRANFLRSYKLEKDVLLGYLK